MKEKICGIYLIKNPEGIFYVGSASNIEHRIISHRRWLSTHPKSRSPLLAESFEKFGVNAHQFEILFVLPNEISRKERLNYENLAIKVVEKLGAQSLNIIGSGKNKVVKNRHHCSFEKYVRSGENKTLHPKPHGSLKCSTAVIAFSKETNQIMGEYRTIKEAAQIWNLSESQILSSADRKHNIKAPIYFERKEPKKERIKLKGHKAVIQLSMDGKEIARYDCIAKAAKATNVNRANLGMCANGKAQSAGGYRWKWADCK